MLSHQNKLNWSNNQTYKHNSINQLKHRNVYTIPDNIFLTCIRKNKKKIRKIQKRLQLFFKIKNTEKMWKHVYRIGDLREDFRFKKMSKARVFVIGSHNNYRSSISFVEKLRKSEERHTRIRLYRWAIGGEGQRLPSNQLRSSCDEMPIVRERRCAKSGSGLRECAFRVGLGPNVPVGKRVGWPGKCWNLVKCDFFLNI